MKRIVVKRLMYHNLATNEIAFGGEEYSGRLTDENILGYIHEEGKTIFQGGKGCDVEPHLLLMKNGKFTHRITVESFYQYQKSWYDFLYDYIKRILRI